MSRGGGAHRVSPHLALPLLYAALYFELGVNLPFFPVWLRGHGLDDAAIGIILAAPLLTRIVANPLVTALADHRGDIARTVALCAGLVLASTLVLAGLSTFWPILLLVVTIAMAQGPLIALVDALTLALGRGSGGGSGRGSGIDYGRMRLWGSIAFAGGTLAGGWTLQWVSSSAIILLLAAAAFATAVAAWAGRHMPTPQPVPSPAVAPQRLGRPLVVAAILVGAAAVQASHALAYGFSTLHWQSEHVSGGFSGLLWAFGVASEVALFAFAGRFIGRPAAPGVLLLVGAGAAVLRWVGMASDPSPALLVILQLGHGLTFGATHLGSIMLLARLAPATKRVQVQGWLAAAWAGLMAVLTAASGRLYPEFGESLYLGMAMVAFAGLLLTAGAIASLGSADQK